MDKKTLPIIIALALIIIFYYPILQFFGLTEKPERQLTPTEQTDTSQTAVTAETSLSGENNGLAATDILLTPTTGAANEPVRADTIKVKTNKYEIALSSFGGGPTALTLNEFTYRDGRNINMLSKAKMATPDFTFAGETFSTANVSFSSNTRAGFYEATSQPVDISYSYKRGGGELIKTYRFYPDSYHFDLIIEITNREQFGFERNYSIVWNTPLDVTEPQIKEDYAEVNAVALMAGSRVTLDDFNDNQLKQSFEGQVSWAGGRSKYFTSAIIPRNSAPERVFAVGKKMDVPTADGPVEGREITVGLTMPLEGTSALSDTFTIFVGPLDYELMASYDVELEDMLGIGTTPYVGWIIKPFALAIIWLLPKMHDFIPNYGVVIIIFAFLVKLITLPLSLKSFKSMQAMKDLQPKIEELKKKHKNNSQAMNQEMMKMYKEHGVNPMSGCLPILPQMPLFFALFSVFRSTILLRNAPFVWFIDDLSRGAGSFTDPYIILVVIMVAAQFVSQKFTMAPSQQNKIFLYIMPLFMGFIFHNFAAGLVLYWTCFSMFSLLDYFVFRRNKNQSVKIA